MGRAVEGQVTGGTAERAYCAATLTLRDRHGVSRTQRDAERVARMAQRLSLAGLRLAREGGAGVEGQGTAEVSYGIFGGCCAPVALLLPMSILGRRRRERHRGWQPMLCTLSCCWR